MKKLLLTSAGFESPEVMGCFLQMLGKPAGAARALYIPTAAIDEEAKAMLPKCWDDLMNAGLLPENITLYDLDAPMSPGELSTFDAVYFCGGSTEFLLARVRATGFDKALGQALEKGLVYVGVSAGSVMAAGNLPDNLGYLPHKLSVHCEKGSAPGPLPGGPVSLTNAQAIRITGDEMAIIGDDGVTA